MTSTPPHPGPPARRARRAFSPSDAWNTEIDFDSERVRSKYSGLRRARLAASAISSARRSAVACGSAASSRTYTSAAFTPPPGGRPSAVPSGPLRWPNNSTYGPRSTTDPGTSPSAAAPGPHHRPGGSPPAPASRR
jgi:hypothetical protein